MRRHCVGFEPFDLRQLSRAGLHVTRLGLGTAPIGGLYAPVSDDDGIAMVDHAWRMGVRYFDTAPLYGYGNAERRVGGGLARQRRDEFVLSTKVGRLVVPAENVGPGTDVDRQELHGQEDSFYRGTPPGVKLVFDFSYDGVMRSVEDSLERLGLDRIDVLFIHDPDDHWQAAIDGAYPALHRLREQGVVGAIGAAMDQAEMLVRFARAGDFDAFLVAGRYTLLDHTALEELLPLCVEKGIGLVIGGVMNSGILADPGPHSRFNYAPADQVWIDRAQRLQRVCQRHDVPLKAAAVQFVLAHPAVTTIVAGVRTPAHLDEYPDLMRYPIPADLWDELRADDLIPVAAPTPPA
jgi:D-threo-aldose 1-dehydrogenase